MAIETVGRQRKRSKAWIYYAALLVVGGFAHPAVFLLAVMTGLYSYYLYQGGRFVIWFWLRGHP